MPEEQEDGYPQFASDIYAVGAIAILCLTGSQPYSLFNKKSRSIEWQHLRQQVNRDFAKVLNKMIAPDYRQRYTNADNTLQEIESLIFPPTSSPVQPVQPSTTKRASTLPTKPIKRPANKQINKSTKNRINRIFTDEKMQSKIIAIYMIVVGSAMFVGSCFYSNAGIIPRLFLIIISFYVIFVSVQALIESSKE